MTQAPVKILVLPVASRHWLFHAWQVLNRSWTEPKSKTLSDGADRLHAVVQAASHQLVVSTDHACCISCLLADCNNDGVPCVLLISQAHSSCAVSSSHGLAHSLPAPTSYPDLAAALQDPAQLAVKAPPVDWRAGANLEEKLSRLGTATGSWVRHLCRPTFDP